MVRLPVRNVIRRPGCSVSAALKMARASSTLAARASTRSTRSAGSSRQSSIRYKSSAAGRDGLLVRGVSALSCTLRLAACEQTRSMVRAVPTTYDAVLVPQCNVALGMLARRGVERGVADAAVRGHRQDLIDAGLGVVPELHPVRKILPPGRALAKARQPAGVVFHII